MANEKVFQSRIQLKHDIEENWSKATNFIPKVGEIIIYDIDENNSIARFKIGDDITDVNSLPFVSHHEIISYLPQELTEEQQIQVRENINAASQTDINTLSDNVAYINSKDNENVEDVIINEGTNTASVSWNDLTDRPFYKIPGEVYLEPTEIDVMVGGNWTKIQTTLDSDALAGAFVEGKTYIFSWNGEDIPLDGGLHEGQSIDWDNTTDLQNPVYKTYLYISGTLATSDGVFPVTLTDSGNLSSEIYDINTDTHPNGYPLVLGIRSADVVKVINKEFLPPVDEYIPNLTDYLPALPEYVAGQTDEQIMDARRKMGLYSTYDAHPVVAEDAYMWDDSGVYGFHGLTEDVLSILSNLTQCRVSLDGVGVYDMEVQNFSEYISPAGIHERLYWVGNGNLLISVDGLFKYLDEITESKYPDVPFAVYYKPIGASDKQWGIVWDATVAPATGDKIIIENLAMVETVVEPVPEEYIPDTIPRKTDMVQADWGQSDPQQPDYIHNRPFGEFGEAMEYVISPQTLTFEAGSVTPVTYIATVNMPTTAGTVLYIHWNGTVYEKAMSAGFGYSVTGDESDPFSKISWGVGSTLNVRRTNTEQAETVEFAISLTPPPTVKQLDEKYIPASIARAVLTSPSGKRFRLTVDDTGALSATEIME